jgi:hypothetical protein
MSTLISHATRNSLIEYTGTFRILDCPSLGKPFNRDKGWIFSGYGFVIGYNYLGGHTNTPWQVDSSFNKWKSPQSVNDDSLLGLITDMNDWSPGYGKTFAPHGKGGPTLKENDFTNIRAMGGFSEGHRRRWRQSRLFGWFGELETDWENQTVSRLPVLGQGR